MGIPHFHFLSNDEFFKFFPRFGYYEYCSEQPCSRLCVCGRLFSTLEYLPRSGIAGPKMSPFSFLLQICRYKIGNWETGYCSQLQVKNWAGSSPFLHLERKVWSAWPATLPSEDTGLGTRQPQVSVHLQWVPVLPAFLLFSPRVCCPELWVFAHTCSLDGLFAFSQALELAHVLSLSSRTLLTQQPRGGDSGASGSHFAFITCYSAVSLLLCLTPEHWVWILFTFVSPCPSCQQYMFSYSWCALHFKNFQACVRLSWSTWLFVKHLILTSLVVFFFSFFCHWKYVIFLVLFRTPWSFQKSPCCLEICYYSFF